MKRRLHVPAGQRGIALLVVLAMVLLCGLLVAGSLRTALLEEWAVGHDADRLRAIAAAEALLRRAERDIRGEDADGRPCAIEACRRPGPGFPAGIEDFARLRADLAGREPSCDTGICVPDRIPAQFWTDAKAFEAMKKVAAPAAASLQAGPHRGWYWVELLAYDTTAALERGTAEALAPDSGTPYIYRVTAIAQGLKPASRAVLQSVLVIKKQRS